MSVSEGLKEIHGTEVDEQVTMNHALVPGIPAFLKDLMYDEVLVCFRAAVNEAGLITSRTHSL